jgi:long-chain fatty acid transport protein
MVRLGASCALPYWVDAPATVKVRLPQAAPFDHAEQRGEDAHVAFRLPPVVRAGVELRPTDRLRVEAAYTREFWSVHDSIDVTPDGIALVGVTGFPSPFPIGKISLPRNFQDASTFHLGAEYRFDWQGYRIDQRVGASYAQSAVPPEYLSPLTIDMDKVTVALGDSLHIGKHWRFDLTYAHVFAMPVDVDPASAKIAKVNPVAGNPTALEAINGGHYSATAEVLGAGLVYTF